MAPRDKKGKRKPVNDKIFKTSSNDVSQKENVSKSKGPPRKQRAPLGYVEKLKRTLQRVFSRQMLNNLIFSPHYLWISACLFLFFETFLNIFIIENVNYTEIDWVAYMQEVSGFLNGTFDYTKLKGDTGPLVYPAGFVYIYSLLYFITGSGSNIHLGQYIFSGFYLVTLCLVFRLYHKSKKLPPYVLIFVCFTSYRVHSIFVLRLFNDPIAMMILYLAINLFVGGRWSLGSAIYSFAVSIKMNILLFAPALLMTYFYCLGLKGALVQLIICAAVQVILGLPFLIANPLGYILQAFDLGRVFLFEWTVNWRFLPEEIFVDKWFHIGLLAAHAVVLAIFALTHWRRYLHHYWSLQNAKLEVSSQLFLLPMFMSNFIGICFSRSLHYQFYIWYFHSLPYLLWSTNFSIGLRLLILGLIELSWNTFPSTWWSSGLLHACHFLILCGLFLNRPTAEKVQSVKKRLQKVD